jgi:hypothetical protein
MLVPRLKAVDMKVDAEVTAKVEQIKVEVIEQTKEIEDAIEYKDE